MFTGRQTKKGRREDWDTLGARHIIETLERDAPLLNGSGDRFSGYAIVGLPFQSGHVLALRRFTASTIGPGYTSVWHRDPFGDWTFYSTVAPDVSCARYFGGQIEHNVRTPIDITWMDAMRFRVAVGTAIGWQITLGKSLTTRLLNTIADVMPERAWQMPAVLRLMGVAARATLGTGPMNLTGLTPNGHRFVGNARRVWSIKSSHAIVGGVNVGPLGPLVQQASLGDFLLPQKGVFAVARTRFEHPVDRKRKEVATTCPAQRRHVAAADARRPDPDATHVFTLARSEPIADLVMFQETATIRRKCL